MKIKVQTQYTIFENPSSEEICKNTPMIKVYLKDGVISTFVWKNSREASRPIYEDHECLNPFKADETINKFIQYPGEFICILRKAFEFHNEELLKDKDRSYRHNTSKVETMDFIGDTITKMIGKRIMYCDLVK